MGAEPGARARQRVVVDAGNEMAWPMTFHGELMYPARYKDLHVVYL
jgi:hypothetical protein